MNSLTGILTESTAGCKPLHCCCRTGTRVICSICFLIYEKTERCRDRRPEEAETHFGDRRRRFEYEFIRSNSARSLLEPDSQRKVVQCGSWGRFCLSYGIPMDSTRIARETSQIWSQTMWFCSAYVAVLLPDDEGEARVVPLVIVDAVAVKWIVVSLGKLRSLRIVYKAENLSVIPIVIGAMKK